jgi:hypothetical protein
MLALRPSRSRKPWFEGERNGEKRGRKGKRKEGKLVGVWCMRYVRRKKIIMFLRSLSFSANKIGLHAHIMTAPLY